MELMRDFDNADTISIDTLALEEIIQDERAREIEELSRLSKKVCCLHTSMLYYRQMKTNVGTICFDVWKTIIKRVGGASKSWRELGVHLGIPHDDLDYIDNSMKDDPTDVVLKVFLQSEDATIDKIIDAFVKMKRYDILKAIEHPLSNLANYFIKDDSKSDTGYHSTGSEKRQIISWDNVPNDLPPVLRSKENLILDEKPDKPRKSEKKQNLIERKVKNDSPILLLTFAEDGEETAFNIRNRINNWPDDVPSVEVIVLNEKKDNVIQNPESFIREYFDKADYVVPILTSGYLNSIKRHSPNMPNMSHNLDFKYVQFIYSLIVNNFIHLTGCMNKKVRSVLPQDQDTNVLMEISMYPDLMPWTNEQMFDEMFQEFLKKDFCTA